ncbi:MAG: bifunctional DNA-formamidopyrimidine glycosylase/DNA-(apurinic or apyrimidinic site) lyase [Acidobacteria bacterium]|nr:bifunctional DNA-formamidopyrimidine glycosylase/DNA-(apurinic or apyrimidinic site) lyase [Acidobacteriota bacterium]
MPELPEVEHVVQTLRRCLRGTVIRDVGVLRPQLVSPMSVASFRARIRSRRVENVRRRAKFILIDLDGERTLMVHLRMTGGFVYAEPDCQLPATTRLVFHLQSGHTLGLTDQRNLGIVKLVGSRELSRLKELQQLGLEPLQSEFTIERLRGLLGGSRRSIKEFLLDQTKVVGIGNIYAAEALHRAGINPRDSAATIAKSRKRLTALHQSIIATLRDAIQAQQLGTPLHIDFIGENSPNGDHSRSDIVFQVYDREDEPCFTCGTRIKRIKQGGRSTYFCPRCQK